MYSEHLQKINSAHVDEKQGSSLFGLVDSDRNIEYRQLYSVVCCLKSRQNKRKIKNIFHKQLQNKDKLAVFSYLVAVFTAYYYLCLHPQNPKMSNSKEEPRWYLDGMGSHPKKGPNVMWMWSRRTCTVNVNWNSTATHCNSPLIILLMLNLMQISLVKHHLTRACARLLACMQEEGLVMTALSLSMIGHW